MTDYTLTLTAAQVALLGADMQAAAEARREMTAEINRQLAAQQAPLAPGEANAPVPPPVP